MKSFNQTYICSVYRVTHVCEHGPFLLELPRNFLLLGWMPVLVRFWVGSRDIGRDRLFQHLNCCKIPFNVFFPLFIRIQVPVVAKQPAKPGYVLSLRILDGR